MDYVIYSLRAKVNTTNLDALNKTRRARVADDDDVGARLFSAEIGRVADARHAPLRLGARVERDIGRAHGGLLVDEHEPPRAQQERRLREDDDDLGAAVIEERYGLGGEGSRIRDHRLTREAARIPVNARLARNK